MNKTDAIEMLDVVESTVEHFEVEDPFNPPNTLTGYITQQADHRYGALLLYKINGEEIEPEVIYGTPKLQYPYSSSKGGRKFRWPQCSEARVYEKWDGTNVLAYAYTDGTTQWVTFKSRFCPVLHESDTTPFVTLWKEILERYPYLRRPEIVLKGTTLSFELFGYRNLILVNYTDIALETKLLFGIDRMTNIILPEDIDLPDGIKTPLVGKLQKHFDGDTKQFDKGYERWREKTERKNKKVDGKIIGSEGKVFFIDGPEGWTMYKLKPQSVENIHKGLNYNAIHTTVMNSLENKALEDLTKDFIISLLKEEFSDEQIEKADDEIAKVIKEVQDYLTLKMKVQQVYKDCPENDKGAIMRYMAPHFEKKEMGQVFGILKQIGVE